MARAFTPVVVTPRICAARIVRTDSLTDGGHGKRCGHGEGDNEAVLRNRGGDEAAGRA